MHSARTCGRRASHRQQGMPQCCCSTIKQPSLNQYQSRRQSWQHQGAAASCTADKACNDADPADGLCMRITVQAPGHTALLLHAQLTGTANRTCNDADPADGLCMRITVQAPGHTALLLLRRHKASRRQYQSWRQSGSLMTEPALPSTPSRYASASCTALHMMLGDAEWTPGRKYDACYKAIQRQA